MKIVKRNDFDAPASVSAGHKATIEDKRCWLKCFSVQIFDSTLSFLSVLVNRFQINILKTNFSFTFSPQSFEK